VAVLFVGCDKRSEYTKKYIVSKSDNNNWTTSGIVECDSVTMVDINTATLWIDGHKMNLKGQTVIVYSNTSYVAPK
jgi:hypothetical protein